MQGTHIHVLGKKINSTGIYRALYAGSLELEMALEWGEEK